MDIETFPCGPFTRDDLGRLGIPVERLRRAIRDLDVVRLLRGVYLRSDVELTQLVKAQAAARVVGKSSVLCDRTAAWILGVDVLRYAELDAMPPLDSYVLRGCEPTERPECSGGTRDLLAEDWCEIGGVRVTTPLRTAVDLACNLRRRDALAAADALMRAYGFTNVDMRRLLVRFFRRRGVIQARQIAALADGRAESPGESWTRLEIVDHGLPAPEPQVWVSIDGVPTYRLDLAYARAKVAIEYDGEEFHTGPEAREADAKRREWLRANGWRVIVVTKDSFGDAALAAWIRELRGYLGLR